MRLSRGVPVVDSRTLHVNVLLTRMIVIICLLAQVVYDIVVQSMKHRSVEMYQRLSDRRKLST